MMPTSCFLRWAQNMAWFAWSWKRVRLASAWKGVLLCHSRTSAVRPADARRRGRRAYANRVEAQRRNRAADAEPPKVRDDIQGHRKQAAASAETAP